MVRIWNKAGTDGYIVVDFDNASDLMDYLLMEDFETFSHIIENDRLDTEYNAPVKTTEICVGDLIEDMQQEELEQQKDLKEAA